MLELLVQKLGYCHRLSALLKNTLAQTLKMKSPGVKNRGVYYNGKRHARRFSANLVAQYMCGRGTGCQFCTVQSPPKGNSYHKIVSRASEQDRRLLQNLLLAWNREGPPPLPCSHRIQWRKLQYFESTHGYFAVACLLD